MNYQETVSYLFERLPMFQRIGKAAYKADLSNTHRLSRLLHHPEDGLTCIHIAGTNGKGSTAHILASILQSCGYKTGLMTSPHYKDYRERIKINGQMISEEYVVDWVAQHQRRVEPIEPSFFELTVMMGFCYFKDQEVDIAIIETGLGGRLDSTNVVSPLLSIITNIGLDHQAFLGDTVEKIALEKAGIIKAKTPVLIGPGNEEVMDVFQRMAEIKQAPLHPVTITAAIDSDLGGAYQQENLATALLAIDILRHLDWTLEQEQVTHGLQHVISQTGMMGRFQHLGELPLIIADAAHNVQGMEALLRGIAQLHFRKLHLVMAMVDDKDVGEVLSLLPKEAKYHLSEAKIIRAMKVEELAKHASGLGLQSTSYADLEAALIGAKEEASAEDLILITGSIFTVAELIP